MTIRYSPPKPKYNANISLSGWFIEIQANDEKRRKDKELECSRRVSNAICSEKILDDNFCNNILPKIVDSHAELIEKNTKIHLKELSELRAYELWHCTPEMWSYTI